MKNKYLEMYKRLEEDWQNYLENKGKLTYEDMVLIKELVNKEKPMKIVCKKSLGFYRTHCPKCDKVNNINDYCYNCGQRLDWSD